MIVAKARKKIYKECVIVLICLLMFGSLTCGAMLCFGSEGRVSIEIKPTDCCDEYLGIPVQASPNSCDKCIDIPIFIGLAKITRVSKQSSSTFPAQVTNVIVPAGKPDLPAYNSASSSFDASSYFTPLGTVILII